MKLKKIGIGPRQEMPRKNSIRERAKKNNTVVKELVRLTELTLKLAKEVTVIKQDVELLKEVNMKIKPKKKLTAQEIMDKFCAYTPYPYCRHISDVLKAIKFALKQGGKHGH